MSLMDLRVELPAHSQSFQVQVQGHWTVREIKAEIQRACPGAPHVDGQRVIWRGRILTDEERVGDIWKSPSDARVVHLAVRPSAWATPPTAYVPPLPTTNEATAQSTPQTAAQRLQATPSPVIPLSFIVDKHETAIRVLTHGRLPLLSETILDNRQARSFAVSALYAHGWAWPAILDEGYPAQSDPNDGVKYEQVVIDNQLYLRLATPNVTPTPIQQHALKILSHTFPLLSITTPDPSAYQALPHAMSYGTTPTTNLNQYLQQVGIPPLRLAPNQPNNPNDPNNPVVAEIRAIPLRALLMPLVMLSFRTFLLMYFFSPSKRPFFGVLLSLWILYETWGALRVVLGDRPAGQGAAQARGDPAAADQGANAQRGQAAAAPAGSAQSDRRGHFDFLLNHMANSGLSSEDATLDAATPAPEPTVARRVKSFVSLMLMTLHPAVWDRRRTALRRREGRLRTEANVRESTPAEGSGEEDANRVQARAQVTARHERRPQWVQRYVERVQVTEWADDS
ncbi:uncharacterized protein PHACADRAFT_114129 [Phanerochaete carnosa HHB-10118-sp]|uniref:Ubiquitin-like domain-containing protein n=1 Tax=Phanerochaete carnosa (strain HHB-10118-sp) TaxID=650164 RepID=K5V9C3_PHACS|nr:uncharacterized protein PHACADRAFT_114129 [Phanerochaete carnosa HHB-10118-sp]EKM59416.1 hypothetical protein PHACADRAFT_114129 [Phanerochaete carnosa HHB-10118-sp]